MEQKQPKVYGYARVSTPTQKIERQESNIKAAYPDAIILSEKYTGTKMDRPIWNRLHKLVQAGDTIVFDEVSRMSRNAQEGFETYQELYNKGVSLVFLKEPHISTSVYQSALCRQIHLDVSTGRESIDKYMEGQGKLLQELLMDLAREQIQIAFDQAQAEVDHLHKRTAEGIAKARLNGHEPGRKKGAVITTKKSVEAKKMIRKFSRDFDGMLNDIDTMRMIGISRNTYYKYKREVALEAIEELLDI